MFPLSLTFPGPFEMALLAAMLCVPAAVILIFLRGRPARRLDRPAFPVIAEPAEPDGAGMYRIVGVDKATRADREMTLEAASRANAQVKAELDGIVVTRVTKLVQTSASSAPTSAPPSSSDAPGNG